MMYQKRWKACLAEAASFTVAVGIAGYCLLGLIGLEIGMLLGLCTEWVVNDLSSFRRSILNIYSLHAAVMLSPALLLAAH
jgi:hypothetical protein